MADDEEYAEAKERAQAIAERSDVTGEGTMRDLVEKGKSHVMGLLGMGGGKEDED